MKKILLTAATAAILTASSTYAAEGEFFLKANVGWDKLNKIAGDKSNNGIFFGVGAGYYVMDNARVDLTFDHYVDPTHKDGTEKIKGEVNTLLLNGFVDLFDITDGFKVFVGAGVGVGQTKAKITDTGFSATAKQKTNVAFAGYIGTSYEFVPDVMGELTYSYRDMGSTKKVEGGDKALRYRGHHVAVGVRFDI